MAGDHIVKGAQGVMSVVFSVGAADGNVTVAVVDEAGAVVVASTNAVHDAQIPGRYYVVIPVQSEVKNLIATWTGTFSGVVQSVVTYAEIVGHLLFTIADARSYGDRTLNDVAAYPDATISQARTRVVDQMASACGVEFIPRYGRDVVDGSDSQVLWLGLGRARRVDHIISAKVAGATVSLSDLVVYPNGKLVRLSGSWPAGFRNVVVEYDHGWRIPSLEITRAGLVWTVFELGSHEIPDRVLTFTTDAGSVVRLAQPGSAELPRRRPSGIPYIDSILARHDETPPILGVA
jgi:hypothetical protein